MTTQNPEGNLFSSEYGETVEMVSVLDQTEQDYFDACDAFYMTPHRPQIEKLYDITTEHINAYEISLDAFKDTSTIEEFASISSNLLSLQDQRRAEHLNRLLSTNQFTAILGKLVISEQPPTNLSPSVIRDTNHRLAEYSLTMFQNKVLIHTNLFLKICAEE